MRMFAVLAEPARYLIVETLASGEHTVAELTDIVGHDYGIGRTAVSHHLRVLRDEHVVIARQDVGSRVYRLHPGVMDRIEREVDQLRERWDNRTGWPYLVDPLAPPRRHRHSTARGRKDPDDPWARRAAARRSTPWRDDLVVDEVDGEHRWVAEGAVLRDIDPLGF
jgi:DNA-binding transcriptional ArsR family regulator